jgi:glycosyltransferase involved in cell wall biosynthesis
MFSIVVPVRDKPHTILRTLAGALAQSFADFELILVGDPGDASLAAAAQIADARIRIVHQRNIGQGPARNAGVDASRSDWIAFLDADDLWRRDHLAELDAVRRAHPDAGLIGTAFVHSDASGRFILPEDKPGRIAVIDYFDAVGRGDAVLHTSSAAIPRIVHDRLGGFENTHFGEDSKYWARIAFSYPVAVSSRVTVVYLHGTGGITDSSRDRWSTAELASARDISPAVEFAIDRHGSIKSARQRRSVARYIRRYHDWCLRRSIALRDVRTVRRLRRIYWGRPSAMHVLLLTIGMLPIPAANGLFALGLRMKAAWRDWLRRARWR